jgi:hypothetical protein
VTNATLLQWPAAEASHLKPHTFDGPTSALDGVATDIWLLTFKWAVSRAPLDALLDGDDLSRDSERDFIKLKPAKAPGLEMPTTLLAWAD